MLIVLYGNVSNTFNGKWQRMINGGATCGYREYARNYGHIIYMSPQQIKEDWEHSISDPKKVIDFINRYPYAVVWSVKHDTVKDSEILSKIDNQKLYYSCNSRNMYNRFCDVSLVDTPERIKKNAKLWFKGKDPNYWKPVNENKEFDYLLVGRRGDKNEIYFLRALNSVKERRKILWVGGKKHERKIVTNHDVVCTDFIGQDVVRDNISKAKVGVLFTELSVEGFPQSYLELSMCGVPVVYNKKAPRNNFYFHKDTCLLCYKEKLIESAEFLLKIYDPIKCRNSAIKNYSLDKSYNHILNLLR